MKRNVKKITLNRETLRHLDARELAQAAGGATIPCYPPTYGPSCRGTCPTEPFSQTNCG